MHALLVILIVLLVIVAVLLGIVVFILLSVFFTLQPILGQLGKVSMVIEALRFLWRRVVRKRQNPEPRGRSSNEDLHDV
ncbi:hypothetical protein LLE49_01235 [Alicyclobacillus tolerans]|uniref:hypothetical protein n=1 Tax=Alicyclobacillus tolerans TaxID=90970 RepID=UPI001F242D75|nr:hypothetical protein [Alicyclobacillus tolerans]MCF8563367.1 hypothetical protein [Alicyclobacillus tolerans]